MAAQKTIFAILMTVVNITGVVLTGIVFVSTSDTYSASGAIAHATFSQFCYVLLVSLVVSAVAFVLTRSFHNSIATSDIINKNIFFIELVFLIVVFMTAYLALSITLSLNEYA